ncbi:hypothetical protein [Acinetobacter nosocomialis]
MKFKAKDKVVFEAHYIPNNQVMTVTRGTYKKFGHELVRVLTEDGDSLALSSHLRLASKEEIETGFRSKGASHE